MYQTPGTSSCVSPRLGFSGTWCRQGHSPLKASLGAGLLPDSLLWPWAHRDVSSCPRGCLQGPREYGFQLPQTSVSNTKRMRGTAGLELHSFCCLTWEETCDRFRRVEIVRRESVGPAHCQGGALMQARRQEGDRWEPFGDCQALTGQSAGAEVLGTPATSGGLWAGDRPLAHLMAMQDLRPRPSQTYWPDSA